MVARVTRAIDALECVFCCFHLYPVYGNNPFVPCSLGNPFVLGAKLPHEHKQLQFFFTNTSDMVRKKSSMKDFLSGAYRSLRSSVRRSLAETPENLEPPTSKLVKVKRVECTPRHSRWLLEPQVGLSIQRLSKKSRRNQACIYCMLGLPSDCNPDTGCSLIGKPVGSKKDVGGQVAETEGNLVQPASSQVEDVVEEEITETEDNLVQQILTHVEEVVEEEIVETEADLVQQILTQVEEVVEEVIAETEDNLVQQILTQTEEVVVEEVAETEVDLVQQVLTQTEKVVEGAVEEEIAETEDNLVQQILTQMDDTDEEGIVETENNLVQQILTQSEDVEDTVGEEIAETEDNLVQQILTKTDVVIEDAVEEEVAETEGDLVQQVLTQMDETVEDAVEEVIAETEDNLVQQTLTQVEDVVEEEVAETENNLVQQVLTQVEDVVDVVEEEVVVQQTLTQTEVVKEVGKEVVEAVDQAPSTESASPSPLPVLLESLASSSSSASSIFDGAKHDSEEPEDAVRLQSLEIPQPTAIPSAPAHWTEVEKRKFNYEEQLAHEIRREFKGIPHAELKAIIERVGKEVGICFSTHPAPPAAPPVPPIGAAAPPPPPPPPPPPLPSSILGACARGPNLGPGARPALLFDPEQLKRAKNGLVAKQEIAAGPAKYVIDPKELKQKRSLLVRRTERKDYSPKKPEVPNELKNLRAMLKKTNNLVYLGSFNSTLASSNNEAGTSFQLRSTSRNNTSSNLDRPSLGSTKDFKEEQRPSWDNCLRKNPYMKPKVSSQDECAKSWKTGLRKVEVNKKPSNTPRPAAIKFRGDVHQLASCYEGIKE